MSNIPRAGDVAATATTLPSVPPINSSLRIPALDGLRGVAILLVLLWHSIFQHSKYFIHHPFINRLIGLGRLSWSGVDLFFALSGFLIGGILLDNRDSPRFFRTFYLRRAYRILPIYFVVVVLCWLASQAGQHGWTPYGRMDLFNGQVPWWSYVTFTQNLWMAAIGGFSRGSISVTWSLAIEEQFYLTLPFIVRRLAPKNLVLLVASVILGAPILRALLILYTSHGGFTAYVLTPCRADALGLGVLSAILVRSERAWNYLLAHRAWIYGASGILGLGIAVITLRAYPLFTGALYGLEYSVLAFFYASVLFIALTGKGKFVKAVFCNKFLMKPGVVAYGTYLLHYIFINIFCFFISHTSLPPVIYFLGARPLGVVATVMVASLSWRFFEKPLVNRARAYKY